MISVTQGESPIIIFNLLPLLLYLFLFPTYIELVYTVWFDLQLLRIGNVVLSCAICFTCCTGERSSPDCLSTVTESESQPAPACPAQEHADCRPTVGTHSGLPTGRGTP
jgi:hypothetical protein